MPSPRTCAIKDGIGHICHLCTCGQRAGRHALQHLHTCTHGASSLTPHWRCGPIKKTSASQSPPCEEGLPSKWQRAIWCLTRRHQPGMCACCLRRRRSHSCNGGPAAPTCVAVTRNLPAMLALVVILQSHQPRRGLILWLGGVLSCQGQSTRHSYVLQQGRRRRLAGLKQQVTHIFCASATFSLGTSIARSPRATMMPSVSARISS